MAMKIFKSLDEGGLATLWRGIITELLNMSVQIKQWANGRFVQSVNGKAGTSITLTKDDLNLSNVDNTADADKRVAHANTAGDADTLDGKHAADFMLKNEHENFEVVIAESLTDLDTRKVDKEDGKGLSSNDYTTEEKTKLAGIESGAQKNTVTSVAGKTGAVSLNIEDINNLQGSLDAKQDNLPFTSAPSESNKVVTQNELNAATAGASIYLGTIESVSALSTTARKGDFYRVKTAWSGVHVGDIIIAEKDNPSAAIDDVNWSLLHNEANTDTTYTFEDGVDGFKVTPSVGTAQNVNVQVKKVNGHTVEKDVPANAVFTDHTVEADVPADAVFTDYQTTKDGHYTPAEDSASKLIASAAGGEQAWEADFVKGVTLKRDAKGHVVGVEVVSGKIPANPNTDYQTTKAGHYTPSRESDISPDAQYIRDAARDIAFIGLLYADSKGHVVGGDTFAVQAFTDAEINDIIAATTAQIAEEMD